MSNGMMMLMNDNMKMKDVDVAHFTALKLAWRD
jgi:hypothetical protein